jgi:hypothetical protein
MKLTSVTTPPLLVLASVLATGCLMPKDGPAAGTVVATGQPLAVVDDVKVWTTTSKEKTAEVQYTDENGRNIGKADVYEDKTHVHTKKIWYPVQGNQQLADEDFFRIAGDEAAANETLSMRENGRKWHRRGLFTMGGGLVAMIGSYFIPYDYPYLRTGVALGGLVGLGAGYYMSYWGAHQMNPETHAVDRSIAERAAHNYNQKIGTSVGVSLNKTF